MVELRNEDKLPLYVMLCHSTISDSDYIHISRKPFDHMGKKAEKLAGNYYIIPEPVDVAF